MSRLLALIFTLGLMWLAACRTDEQPRKQDRIFGDFFVRYLSEEQQLKAHASYFEGDSMSTATTLTFAGGVSFQGREMVPRALPDESVRYTFNGNGNYSDSFEFIARNNQNKTLEHKLEMAPIEGYFLKGPISKSSGMTIVIKGSQLTARESIVLLFSDEQNRASTITIQGPTNSIEHFIPKENLFNLQPGAGRLYLVKKKSSLLENEECSFISDLEYYSATIDIEVVE